MIAPRRIVFLLLLALLIDGIVFMTAFNQFDEWSVTIRHTARWTGRVSLIIYVLAFVRFLRDYAKSALNQLQNLTLLFSFLHLIHFVFLASNVHLNAITLVPFKLVGGALAYAMIVAYPFFIHRFKERIGFHLVYFYYVGFVMAVTIIARLRGDFEGAVPSKFHYIGLAAIVLVFTASVLLTIRNGKAARN